MGALDDRAWEIFLRTVSSAIRDGVAEPFDEPDELDGYFRDVAEQCYRAARVYAEVEGVERQRLLDRKAKR